MKTANNTLVLDAYNANPTSMSVAIDNFMQMKGNNKAMVIGDMLELGNDEIKEHQTILNKIIESKLSEVFLVGKVFSQLAANTGIKAFSTVEIFNDYIKNSPLKEMLVLVKGSHGIHLERTVEYL